MTPHYPTRDYLVVQTCRILGAVRQSGERLALTEATARYPLLAGEITLVEQQIAPPTSSARSRKREGDAA